MSSIWCEPLPYRIRFLYIVLLPNLLAAVGAFVYLMNLDLPETHLSAPFADLNHFLDRLLVIVLFFAVNLVIGFMICCRKWRSVQATVVAGVATSIMSVFVAYGFIAILKWLVQM